MNAYKLAQTFSEQCEHQFNHTCKKRNKLRDCYRPLCCGFCPSNCSCEDLCLPIQQFINAGGIV